MILINTNYIDNVYTDYKNKTDEFLSKMFLDKFNNIKMYFDSILETINENVNEDINYYLLEGSHEHENIKLKLVTNQNENWYFRGFQNEKDMPNIKGLDDFDINNYKGFVIIDNYYHYGVSIAIAWNDEEFIISSPNIIQSNTIKFLKIKNQIIEQNEINDYSYILLLFSTVIDTLFQDEDSK